MEECKKVSKASPFCEALGSLAMVLTLGYAWRERGVSPNSHAVVGRLWFG